MSGAPSERLLLVARLKADAYERARELAAAEPAGDFGEARIRRSIFLSPSEVIFVIEGDDVGAQAREWFDDPVRSAALSSWLPLFDGPLHVAREVGVGEPHP